MCLEVGPGRPRDLPSAHGHCSNPAPGAPRTRPCTGSNLRMSVAPMVAPDHGIAGAAFMWRMRALFPAYAGRGACNAPSPMPQRTHAPLMHMAMLIISCEVRSGPDRPGLRRRLRPRPDGATAWAVSPTHKQAGLPSLYQKHELAV